MQKKYAFIPFSALIAATCLLTASLVVGAAVAAPPADFRDLVKAAGPAVVNINTERTEKGRAMPPGFEMFRGHPDMDQFFDRFEDFYNKNNRQGRKSSSLGSGFIISSDGYIVTNNHVVEGADVIRVNMGRKNKEEVYDAVVVGTDPETDLALVKIKAEGLPTLKFGDSNALEVGDWVLAIGSPLGLDHTVTAGIVSAKGRNIQSGSFDDFLQTDASINRGNSGGPLLNMAGEVVGINTAIAQRAQGIGFAIPSSLAQRIVLELKEHKKVSRGWLGVTIQNVDASTSKALEMKEPAGALVNSVLEGQPADRAGVKGGDVIIAVNDTAIEDTEHLLRTVALLAPGSSAAITVWRDGKEEKLTLTVAERDLKQAAGGRDKKNAENASDRLGIKVRPVSPDDVRRFNLASRGGLLIAGVEEDGLAAAAGIEPGDVILAVNKQPVNSTNELASQVDAAAKKHGALLLHIARKGQVFFRGIDLSAKK